MQYYAMSNNTAKSKGWTYAPRFHSIDELVHYECSKCGAIAKYPVGQFAIDLEGGSKYPDILLCGAYPLLIVSERVLKDWEREGFKGYNSFPLEIRNIDSSKLNVEDALKYFSIEVSAKCELDLKDMGVEVEDECSECVNVKLSKSSWEIERLTIKPESVANADIFISTIFPRKILVSEKVVKCACENKHTNFEFVKAEESLSMFREPIDYLKFC